MRHAIRILFAATLLAGSGALSAQTQEDSLLPVAEAFRADHGVAADGRLRLAWDIADDYYLYRHRISVRADNGTPLGELELPPGTSKQDEYFGDVQVYHQRVEAWLPAPARLPGALSVTVQGCHEVEPLVCYPPFKQTYAWTDAGFVPASGDATPPQAGNTAGEAVPAAATQASLVPSPAGIATILLLALLGGLVLNLMPCVLPVLSLKVLSLAHSGANYRAARRHALWYTAGVLASFSALGLLVIAARAAGQSIGWGFQLQQPAAVGILAYVMFVLALALSGAVLIGTRLGGVGQSLAAREGAAGDFFTGVLAVVVASPCTAPFMGVALAYALTASAWVALAVFLALGLGLALPFLAIGFVPALSSRLPRPGAWMETLKQLLAFPLYATVAWLAWVLTRQRGADALAWLLAGLLLLALGLWLGERLRHAQRRPVRASAWVVVALALLPLWRIHHLPVAAASNGPELLASDGSVPYSPTALDALRRDGRPVFVNITADWCVTCKVNEKRLFDTENFRDALKQRDAVYVKGDWTNIDASITGFLKSHGAVGVPLYVAFDGKGHSRVLPSVPTRTQIELALDGITP